jgi:hypothetical protein
MNTNRLAVSAASMALALAGAMACSTDNPTAPAASVKIPAVFNIAGSDPGRGEIIACKTGSAATFTVVFSGNFIAGEVQNLVLVSGQTYTLSLNAGQCKTIYSRVAGGPQVNPEAIATITEGATPGFTLTAITAITETDESVTTDVPNRRATVAVNMFHDAQVTFVNTAIPTTGCTFTKGWYRNNGSNTIIALADGLTKSQQQQVFDATPGQPGLVTWNGGNNTLNLYQQLLAAINNLGGNLTAGPTAVDVAVAAALAGTSVTTLNGGVQITVAAGTDVSGLIDVLSSFNEGDFTGWPHCDD